MFEFNSTSELPLFRHTNYVKIGKFYRYTITYRVRRSELESAPKQLSLRVKNLESPAKRLLYLLGPYIIYAQLLPYNFNEVLESNVEPDDERLIQLKPNIHPGNSFHASLTLNGNSLVSPKSDNQSTGNPSEFLEYKWRLDILSQALLSQFVKVDFEVQINKGSLSEDSSSDYSNNYTDNSNATGISSGNDDSGVASPNIIGLGSLKSLLPRPSSPSITSHASSPTHTSGTQEFSATNNISVDSPNLTVDIESCDDIWNKPPPRPDQPIHLVVLTHGIYSNVGCDLLFLKEKLESVNANNENIMIRGYHGNVANTEKGIKWLGINLANFVDGLINDPYYNIDRISFIGHSLGGVVQSFAIYYMLNYQGYKTGNIRYSKNFAQYAHEFHFTEKSAEDKSAEGSSKRVLLKHIRPINFITLASPLLGTQSEFANLINLGLEFGSLGKSGKDLSLRNRYFSKFTLTPDETTTHLLLKPLLEIIPLDLKFHYYMRNFKNRTVFANVLNDGIVPLKTSALLYLDYKSLSIVEHLRKIAKLHEEVKSKSGISDSEKAQLEKENDETTLQSRMDSTENKERESRLSRLRSKTHKKEKSNVGVIPEDEQDTRGTSSRKPILGAPVDDTRINEDQSKENDPKVSRGSDGKLWIRETKTSNQDNNYPENFKPQSRSTTGSNSSSKKSSFLVRSPSSLNSSILKSPKLKKKQKQIQRIQTITKSSKSRKSSHNNNNNDDDDDDDDDDDENAFTEINQKVDDLFNKKSNEHGAVSGGSTHSSQLVGRSSTGATNGHQDETERLEKQIYAPPQSSSILSAINVLLSPAPRKDFFKNFQPINQSDISKLLSDLNLNDSDGGDSSGQHEDGAVHGKPNNKQLTKGVIDNQVIVHDKVYTYDELPPPYLNKVSASKKLGRLYSTISAHEKHNGHDKLIDGKSSAPKSEKLAKKAISDNKNTFVNRKVLKMRAFPDDIIQSEHKDNPFLYSSRRSNILIRKHFKSKQLAEKIARLYQFDKPWRKVLVNLRPDAHNNIIVRRQFVNSYGWNVINYLAAIFDYEGAINAKEAQQVLDATRKIDSLESVYFDASASPIAESFVNFLKSPLSGTPNFEEGEDVGDDNEFPDGGELESGSEVSSQRSGSARDDDKSDESVGEITYDD